MKEKRKDQGHLIVANVDRAQRTGSGDDMDGIHCWFTLWGYSRPWRASCASERRGIKERREGSLDEGGVRAALSPKEERTEGGPVRGRGRVSKADRRTGKVEAHSARGR